MHVLTKVNIDAPKPTENISIGTSYVFLPTFWCAKCDSWSSHHDKIHDEHLRWQKMKNAQMAKQEEYRKQKQQTHYGPPQLQDRSYGPNEKTNDQTPHTVATTTRTNAQEMIAADHPREIAPTPIRAARAAQVITTETLPHSTKIKRNTR
jgi:hypothetical protein